MKVIITGGGGFLGSQLCQKLLQRGELTGPSGGPETIEQIVLLDAFFHRPAEDARVVQMKGDISDRDFGRTRAAIQNDDLGSGFVKVPRVGPPHVAESDESDLVSCQCTVHLHDFY